MAAKFRFRLQAVLRLRAVALDQQQRTLGDALREVAAREARAARMSEELDEEHQATRGEVQRGPIELGTIRARLLHRHWLNGQLGSAQEDLATAQGTVSVERQKLADAKRRVDVMEKLRERQWLRFRKDAERAEQSALDEAATQRFVREKRAGSDALC